MRKRLVVVLPVLLAMGACMEGERVITVNPDGSGTIVDTIRLGDQARAMVAGMEAEDKSTPAEKRAKKEAALRERATGMGDGVAFVSYVPSVNDGPEIVTYAFKDISKLKIDPMPEPSSSESKSEKKDLVEFRLARKGDRSVLTVIGAAPKPGEKKEQTPKEAQAAAQMKAQAMAMMKAMMKGLKMTSTVEVSGRLLKTSSPWVEGSRVTLLQIDFDKVAADEENFKRFAAAGDDPKSMDPVALKGIKGVKFNPEPEITIEFAR